MKWHSVLLRIPDSDTIVLVHVPQNNEPVWLGYFDGEHDRWNWIGGSEIEQTVTHWMELPQPPEAKR